MKRIVQFSPLARPRWHRVLWLGLLSASLFTAAVLPSAATAPAQVQNDLAAGEPITFVDVRPTALFQHGHIPGAINVPAALCPAKKLPPLGRVVVYDDGLAPRIAAGAAAALNQKPGIRAEVLDGGLPAWQMLGGSTTQRPGLEPEHTPSVTYATLKEIQGPDVVLVDLRQPRAEPQARTASTQTAAAPRPLTDLQAEFPQARLARSPFDTAAAKLAAPSAATPATVPPLLVLIDCNDGAAARMARTLKAQGIARFAILLGGESSLERRGAPGLQRRGIDLSVQLPATSVEKLAHP
jgi:rhodanese-related sulfurtransferase